jgi:predicted enzyme related to lactoylglutathione lyase
MFDLNLVLLYVDSPTASAAFYEKLIGRPPVELSATFALFKLESGLKLGLWSKHTVEPSAMAAGGGGELAFAVASHVAVQAQYANWSKLGVAIEQELTEMDFGYTFVALDPDNHRLRVYALNIE